RRPPAFPTRRSSDLHLVMPISRRVQAAKGDVTEAADEAVVGIEMVQAFGREDDVRARFGGKATSVRDIVVQQAGVEAKHLPAKRDRKSTRLNSSHDQ